MSTNHEFVRSERRGAVCVITIDNPPVNALGYPVREGLLRAARSAAQSDAGAIVIACAGRTFVAGADISEFGKPPKAPFLSEVFEALERAGKPVVAALHGTALGGGLELAMACTHRVAAPSAKVGLPEVNLGIIPGAGGTQRLPRLVGVEKALAMILSGAPISAQDGVAAGLIDAIIDGDLVTGAVEFATRLAEAGETAVPVRDRDDKVAPFRGRSDFFAQARTKAAAKGPRFKAPPGAVDAIEAAVERPFDEGLAFERQTALALVASPESAAQRYFFFAEREAAKIPNIDRSVKVTPAESAAVIGAGTMGVGITVAMVNAGIRVTLIDTNQDAIDRGLKNIRAIWDRQASQGRLKAEDVERRMGLIFPTVELAAMGDADVVVEAVYEAMPVKLAVFADMDRHAKPGAVLGTNTSGLDIDDLAATISRPEAVVGLHFFSPAHVMRLLEVVRAKATSTATLAAAMDLGKRLRKVAVVVGVCSGFVGNRIFRARESQAKQLLVEGATPEQVDRVLKDFGFPMGTFALFDLTGGIELQWRVRQDLGQTEFIGDALVERGRFGQKTKKGFYAYGEDGRTPISDPEVIEIIEAASRDAGVTRRTIPDQEIRERMLYPMINEGAKILEEGVALRASDIDVVWVTGYGWPIWSGGPMYWADQIGLATVLDALRRLQATHGDYFKPSALLERLVAENSSFGAFDRGLEKAA